MTDKKPMAVVNMEMVDKVFQHIREENHWNQTSWVQEIWLSDADDYDESTEDEICGTNRCFGGWAVFLAGRIKGDSNSSDSYAVDEAGVGSNWFVEACRVLGFNPWLGEKVFYNYTSDLDDFEAETRVAIAALGDMTRDEVRTEFDSNDWSRTTTHEAMRIFPESETV